MGLYLLQGAWTWIQKCQIDNTFKVQCIMHVGESIDNARKWNHSVIVWLELIKIAKRKCHFFIQNLAHVSWFLVLIKIIIKDHEGHVEMFLDMDINMKCLCGYETLSIPTSNLIDPSWTHSVQVCKCHATNQIVHLVMFSQ